MYEADPLECPKCKGPMRVIALIEDPQVIGRIFEHLSVGEIDILSRIAKAVGIKSE